MTVPDERFYRGLTARYGEDLSDAVRRLVALRDKVQCVDGDPEHFLSGHCVYAVGPVSDLHDACEGQCRRCAAPCRCRCHDRV